MLTEYGLQLRLRMRDDNLESRPSIWAILLQYRLALDISNSGFLLLPVVPDIDSNNYCAHN